MSRKGEQLETYVLLSLTKFKNLEQRLQKAENVSILKTDLSKEVSSPATSPPPSPSIHSSEKEMEEPTEQPSPPSSPPHTDVTAPAADIPITPIKDTKLGQDLTP